jgi:hypothetical protein
MRERGTNNLRSQRFALLVLASGILFSAFSACGPQIKNESQVRTRLQGDPLSSGEGNQTGTGGGGGVLPPPPGTGAGTGSGAPMIQAEVEGVGYTSTYFTLPTRSILRVKFIPGIQKSQVEGTGFTPQYSKLGVYITVNGKQSITSLLSNGLSSSVSESRVFDFSNVISNNCGTDEDCREDITIEVHKPNYDYWCFNFPSGFYEQSNKGNTYRYPSEYCPHTQVYDTEQGKHPWNGTLVIQTDDTQTM